MPTRDEELLPSSVLARASLSGNEYAWRIKDIPDVIAAARLANLVSIGGQLQFRLPDGVCECYWVEVDTYKSVEKTLPWLERVARTADVALSDFSALTQRYDFTAEGQIAFGAHLDAVASKGGDPSGFMCFVWCVERQVRETAGKV